jgi:hypothetical protein
MSASNLFNSSVSAAMAACKLDRSAAVAGADVGVNGDGGSTGAVGAEEESTVEEARDTGV